MSTSGPGGDTPEDGAAGDVELNDTEVDGLNWLVWKERPAKSPIPMDTVVQVSASDNYATVDAAPDGTFSRDRVWKAASSGNAALLGGLLQHLRAMDQRLTGPELTETNGKTALLKALLNLKDGKNDTIEVFLDIAEKTGDLENLVNAAYKDVFYKGQTPLHVAIERRSFDQVKLLVQKGADVQAKASGKFFQLHSRQGFYFGELPLSLAACTNQLDVVCFLMENQHRQADLTDRDSQGNTVLHALVVIADNTEENTEFIIKMYDEILIRQNRLAEKSEVKLEEIENNQSLTPMKLAAKMGKIGLFRHIVQREFTEEETRVLSRKFTEWVYGPVHSSLYDVTCIDTEGKNSVLEIIVFGSEIPNRQEMLQIEPLRSLLTEKWTRFASKIFLMNFVAYLLYLGVFTTVAFYRKEGQPPFPVENNPVDYLRCAGELFSVLGAVYFFCKAIIDFKRKPPRVKSLHLDGFNEILFFLQAILLLLCVALYAFGRREYVGPLVLSLALAWINILYYSRGSSHMGMYNVTMQRMIMGDILRFLCVYAVFLFGFSAAIVALIEESPPEQDGAPAAPRRVGLRAFECRKPTYNNLRFTALELFKFTIGMGDLEFTDQVQYMEMFYILLISYIVLTYIMLLNMLIALMGDTVERISRESENIWKLQRALTILDLERALPRTLRDKLRCGVMETACFSGGQGCRRFLRVEEMNWKKWRSDLGILQEEDPGGSPSKAPTQETSRLQGGPWRLSPLLERIRARRPQLNDTSVL